MDMAVAISIHRLPLFQRITLDHIQPPQRDASGNLLRLAVPICRWSPAGKRRPPPQDSLLSLWLVNPGAGDPGHHSSAPDAQTLGLNQASVLLLNCALLGQVPAVPAPHLKHHLSRPASDGCPGVGQPFLTHNGQGLGLSSPFAALRPLHGPRMRLLSLGGRGGERESGSPPPSHSKLNLQPRFLNSALSNSSNMLGTSSA